MGNFALWIKLKLLTMKPAMTNLANQSSFNLLKMTLSRFINPKRMVVLAIFALVCANAIIVLVGYKARIQVLSQTRTHHGRIYSSFEKDVERYRATMNAKNPAAVPASPWWLAWRDLVRKYPINRFRLIVSSPTLSAKDKTLLEGLKNKPRGFTTSDEHAGWSRSYFLLPTKNAAALVVYSYVKEELLTWRDLSVGIGIYSFFIFMSLGWFWTRAQQNEISLKVQGIRKILDQVSQTIQEIDSIIQNQGMGAHIELQQKLEQIQLLAVNGSIEAMRTDQQQRVFLGILQEINQLAMQSKASLLSADSNMKSVVGVLKSNIDTVRYSSDKEAS